MQAKDLHFLYCFRPLKLEKNKYTIFWRFAYITCRRDVTQLQICAQIQAQVLCTRVTTGLIHRQFTQVIDLLFTLFNTSRSKTYLDQLDCALTLRVLVLRIYPVQYWEMRQEMFA